MVGGKERSATVFVVSAVCFLLAMSGVTFAYPYLQLDVSDGVYLPAPEETISATTNPFTLYAVIDSESSVFVPSATFYVSAAIVPSLDSSEVDLGSFEFDETEIYVTEDMVYGTPPIEQAVPDNADLPSHGIFETWFTEFSFSLDLSKKAAAYNAQDNPGGLVPDGSGPFYYEEFVVDVGGLMSGYYVHFDLYTLNPDGTIADKAPFSHDAVSVPVPGAMLLGSMGLSAAGYFLKRRKDLA